MSKISPDFVPQLLAGMVVNFEIAAIALLIGLAVGGLLTLAKLAGGARGAVATTLIGLMRAAPTYVVMFFLLNIIQKVFTGPLPERWSKFPDLTSAEILTVAPAIALMFVLGIYPQVLIALFNKP